MREIANLYIERTKRRWFIGCISTLVSIPIMCCCFILLPTVILPALDTVAAAGNENVTMFLMLAVVLAALVGLIGLPVAILFWQAKRRSDSLDAIFTSLGLTGSQYLLSGRHYQGQLGGREVDIYIYRGPTVEFRLKAGIQTRVQFFQRDSIPVNVASALNKPPLEALPGLDAYAVYPLDETWARGLLADPQVVEAIQTLMTLGAEWAIFRRLEIQPGEVLLHLYRSRQMFGSPLESSAAQAWLSALASLARLAESQPAPSVTAEPFTAASRASRASTNNFVLYAVLFIVVGMPLCFIAIGVLAYLFAVYAG